MRFAEPIFRCLAAGVLINLGAMPVRAEVYHGTQGSLQDRVFFDRSSAPEIRARISRVAEATIVAIPEQPLNAGRGPLLTMGARSKRIVVAALGPPKGGSLAETVLPWASGPAVPRPLSVPPPAIDADEKIPADGNAALPRLDRPPPKPVPVVKPANVRAKVLARLLAARSRPCTVCVATKKLKMSLEGGRPAMSRLPPRKRMSTHISDPLAHLEFDAEGAGTAQALAPEFIMPFAKGRVTSLFNQGRRHPAIDLAGALGSHVFATTTGQTVVFAGRRGGYGNAVITRDAYGRTHLYGHLSKITSRVGQLLDQGEKLGHLGSTGHSTGPHVHYEVKTRNGQHINPVTLLFPGRRVGKGLAWVDVGQFGVPSQLARRVADNDRVASARSIGVEPRASPPTRKARRKQISAARYAQRSRRASEDDDD